MNFRRRIIYFEVENEKELKKYTKILAGADLGKGCVRYRKVEGMEGGGGLGTYNKFIC